MKKIAKFSAALAIVAAAATSALAAPETYTVEGTHTFPAFSYNHLGLSTQISKFNKTTGTVVYDAAAKTGSVDITIDMTSIETGVPVFNKHIQAEGFLDTAKFPTATFKSSKVVFEGDKPTAIEGNLTINGVTKAVTLKVTNFVAKDHPMNKKAALGADASVVIKRTDFNAGKFAPAVGDEVTITIGLEAIKM